MSLIIPLHQVKEKDRERVGGKAFSLAILSQMGMHVSEALCVKAEASHQFVTCVGLRETMSSLLSPSEIFLSSWMFDIYSS